MCYSITLEWLKHFNCLGFMVDFVLDWKNHVKCIKLKRYMFAGIII